MSADNEKKARGFLKVRCSLLLRVYATSAEEDERALAAQSLGSYALVCATSLVLAEKRILKANIDML